MFRNRPGVPASPAARRLTNIGGRLARTSLLLEGWHHALAPRSRRRRLGRCLDSRRDSRSLHRPEGAHFLGRAARADPRWPRGGKKPSTPKPAIWRTCFPQPPIAMQRIRRGVVLRFSSQIPQLKKSKTFHSNPAVQCAGQYNLCGVVGASENAIITHAGHCPAKNVAPAVSYFTGLERPQQK